MYKVLNNTGDKLFLADGSEIPSGDSKVVAMPSFSGPPKAFKSVKLGVCEITSHIGGKHTTACFGEQLTCSPSEGRDGTYFILSEKN